MATPRLAHISLNSTDELVAPSVSHSPTTTTDSSISPRSPATTTVAAAAAAAPETSPRPASPANSTRTLSRSNSLRRKPVPSYIPMPDRSPKSNPLQLPAGHPFFTSASSPSQANFDRDRDSPLTPGTTRMEEELFFSPPRGPVPPRRSPSKARGAPNRVKGTQLEYFAPNLGQGNKSPPASPVVAQDQEWHPLGPTSPPAIDEETQTSGAQAAATNGHGLGEMLVDQVDPMRPNTFHGLNINLNLGEPISISHVDDPDAAGLKGGPDTDTTPSTPTSDASQLAPAEIFPMPNGFHYKPSVEKNLPPLPKDATPPLGHSHARLPTSSTSSTSGPTTPREKHQGIEYHPPPRPRAPRFHKSKDGQNGKARATSSSRRPTPNPTRSATPAATSKAVDEDDDEFSVDRLPSRRNLLEVSTMFLRDEDGQLVCFGELFPPSPPPASGAAKDPATPTPEATPMTLAASSSSRPSTPTAKSKSKSNLKWGAEVSRPPPNWRKTVVFFIRHFWCGQCQDFTFASVSLLDKAELDRNGIRVVVISNGSWKIIKSYRKLFNCEFQVLVDVPTKLYHLMGMTKMTNAKGPMFKGRAAYHQRPVPTQILHGLSNALKMPLADPGKLGQLGGEFILGHGNTCEFAHRMTNTSNHMEAPDVLRVAGVSHPTKTEIVQLGLEVEQRAELERLHGEMRAWNEQRQTELERIRQRKAARRGEVYVPGQLDDADGMDDDGMVDYANLDGDDDGLAEFNIVGHPFEGVAAGSEGVEERFRRIMLEEQTERTRKIEHARTVELAETPARGNGNLRVEVA